MKIAVADLRPNPFRDLSQYPINQDKVKGLVASIKDTDFWDNLLARKTPNGGDGYQLPYGVHRLEALKEARIREVDIPVRKIDDTMMLKIMAHENQSEWAHNALVDQETIRAIIKAFGEGKIELPTPPRSDGHGGSRQARYAPSFTPNLNPGRPEFKYTEASLSKFLGGKPAGWSEGKIEAVLTTLAATEQGVINREDLAGLTTHQAEAVSRQARRVAREYDPELARNIGRRLASGMRTASGSRPGVGSRPGRGTEHSERQAVTYHGARAAAEQMIPPHRRRAVGAVRPQRLPDIDKFSAQLATEWADLPTPKQKQKMSAIVQHREHLQPRNCTMLANAARRVAKRWTDFADKLEG